MKTHSQKSRRSGFKFRILSTSIAALVICGSYAANQTWTGGSAVSGLWSTTGDWSGGAAPGSTSVTTSTDIATFNAAIAHTWGNSAANPVVIDPSRNISGINFDAAAGNYFIGSTGGNSLHVSNGGTIQILGTLTATNAVETINAPLLIEGASGAYTLANNSAGGAGAGSGTLNIGGGITGGAAGTTTLTLSGSNTNANTISGIIANGTATKLGVIKSGAATWAVSGANTYTGVTEIDGGILNSATFANVNTASGIGKGSAAGSAADLVFGGGTLQYTGNANVSTTRLFTIGDAAGLTATIDSSASGTLSFTATGAIAFAGSGARTLTLTGFGSSVFAPILGDGGGGSTSLIKTGSGTWVVSGANTYSGVTGIDGGILNSATVANVNTASAIGNGSAAGSAADLVFGGGTLQYTGNANASTDRLFTIGDAAGLTATIDSSAALAANQLSFLGTGAIAFGGSGAVTLTLTGTNTGVNTFLPVLGDSPFGSTALIKTGAGTWTLAGANTYTGNTTVSAGTLNLTGSIGSNASPVATLTVDGPTGTLMTLGSGGSIVTGFENVGGAFAGNFTQTGGAHTVDANLILAAIGTSSNGTYTLSGTGSTLSANNEFVGRAGIGNFIQTGGSNTIGSQLVIGFGLGSNGTYTLSGGTLRVGSIVTGGGASTFNFNGGTLQASVSTTTFMTGLTAAKIQAGGAKIDLQSFNVTIGQALTHDSALGSTADGGLIMSGSGTLTLTGVNTYTGGTTVSAGTLDWLNTNAKPSSGTTTVAANATLALGVATSGSFFTSANVDSLFAGSLAGVSNNTFSNVGIDTTQADFTYASNIPSTSRGLTKLGSNILTLTGTDSYTGPTAVNAGTLLVSGSISGSNPTTVSDTGILAGTGATVSTIIVNSGGTLAPGGIAAVGTLNTGALELNGTGTFHLQLNTSTISASKVFASGGLFLDGGNTFVLSLTDLGANAVLPIGTILTFIDYSGISNHTFAGHPNASTFAFGANNYEILYNAADPVNVSNAVELVTVVVPEPGSAALLGLGGFLLASRRRRKVAAAQAR